MRTLSALPASLLSLVATLVLPPAAFADELRIDTTRLVTCSRPTKAGDSILVHYNGTLQSDGSTFDSSYNRGTPLGFVLGAGQVIQGWDQGLLHMCPGEIRTLTIPPELAYGDRGAPPVIPPGATLVFETELMSIKDAVQWKISTVIPVSSTTVQATQTTGDFVIATVPNTPSPKETDAEKEIDAIPTLEGKPLKAPSGDIKAAAQEGECHLLGPFALFVQAALGVVALLSLVVKRWRETPKRPWTVWFFDVSKQVIGAMLVHVLNLMMSMFGNGVDLKNAAQHAVDNDEDGVVAAASIGGGRARPNPCSFYLLNLAIDTTIGIPILYLLLKILHVAFSYTPLARPPQSIKTGHYGQPPKATWWLKQSLIYFIGLTGMKLFVLSLFALLPWLPWVGDWALRWTEGNEAVQIAFTMFIFPLLMNGLQYWIIDSFIKESGKTQKGDDGAGEYERVRSRDGDEDDDTVDDEETLVVDESDEGSGSKDAKATLKEVNPTPLPDYDRGEGSRTVSPKAEDEAWS